MKQDYSESPISVAGRDGSCSDQVGVQTRIESRVDDLLDLECGAKPMSLLDKSRLAFGLREAKSLAFDGHLQKAGMLKFAEHYFDLLVAARYPQASHKKVNFSTWSPDGGFCHA
jgi:hypothetical protein